ncbi:MAG TPA: hypothetical protein VFQ00_04455 [Terriglobales bacterium]|nr:hypothetical protein [Terriglobales bacterium]
MPTSGGHVVPRLWPTPNVWMSATAVRLEPDAERWPIREVIRERRFL